MHTVRGRSVDFKTGARRSAMNKHQEGHLGYRNSKLFTADAIKLGLHFINLFIMAKCT
jgi:hypothetical protein